MTLRPAVALAALSPAPEVQGIQLGPGAAPCCRFAGLQFHARTLCKGRSPAKGNRVFMLPLQ